MPSNLWRRGVEERSVQPIGDQHTNHPGRTVQHSLESSIISRSDLLNSNYLAENFPLKPYQVEQYDHEGDAIRCKDHVQFEEQHQISH